MAETTTANPMAWGEYPPEGLTAIIGASILAGVRYPIAGFGFRIDCEGG